MQNDQAGAVLVQVGKIARSEGVLSMWRTGVVPNMNRATGPEHSTLFCWHLHASLCLDTDGPEATIITVGQLAAYDTCKEVFVDAGHAAITYPQNIWNM